MHHFGHHVSILQIDVGSNWSKSGLMVFHKGTMALRGGHDGMMSHGHKLLSYGDHRSDITHGSECTQ